LSALLPECFHFLHIASARLLFDSAGHPLFPAPAHDLSSLPCQPKISKNRPAFPISSVDLRAVAASTTMVSLGSPQHAIIGFHDVRFEEVF